MFTLRPAAIVMFIGSLCISTAAADRPAVAKAEVLVSSDAAWNGKPYEGYPAGRPQLTVVRISIPAHATLPWHTHPAPNATYIVSGHLTVEDRASGRKRTLKTGDAFNEQVGAEHRGLTDDEPCVVVVTYSGTAGVPTSVPAAGEQAPY
jgi:quercetin dioxygenase-like cupin family protein